MKHIWSVIYCYNVGQGSRVVAINGKAMALKWNVVEFGQFPLINCTDAEHIYVSVCGSVATKRVLSCLLLHLGYDTFLEVSIQMGKK